MFLWCEPSLLPSADFLFTQRLDQLSGEDARKSVLSLHRGLCALLIKSGLPDISKSSSRPGTGEISLASVFLYVAEDILLNDPLEMWLTQLGRRTRQPNFMLAFLPLRRLPPSLLGTRGDSNQLLSGNLTMRRAFASRLTLLPDGPRLLL